MHLRHCRDHNNACVIVRARNTELPNARRVHKNRIAFRVAGCFAARDEDEAADGVTERASGKT
jgi:hypothetical protein